MHCNGSGIADRSVEVANCYGITYLQFCTKLLPAGPGTVRQLLGGVSRQENTPKVMGQ